MRISRAFVVVLALFGLVLAACSSDEPSSEPVTQSPESEGGEGASSSLPAREVTFAPVDPGMLGMHVAGAQEGD